MEEFVSEILNNITDDVVMGEKSNYNTLVNHYVENGYSENDAITKAFVESYVSGPLKAALGGMISGGIFGAGAVGLSSVGNKTDNDVDNDNNFIMPPKSNVDDGKQNAGKYSISEIKGPNVDYGVGVVLDTDLVKDVKPRNWNNIVNKFVYENLAGKELNVYTADGQQERVYFADKNERVTKDGSEHSRKVLDKLARTEGNINRLSVLHIDELLQTSRNFEGSTDNSHKWLDENGWEYKKAYVQDINGNIYETTLNIAKANDGRRILYALSNTKRVDAGVVPSSKKVGARTQLVNSADIITQDDDGVKNNITLPPGASDVKIVEGVDQSPEMIKTINAVYQRTGLIISFGRKYNPDGSVDTGFKGYIDGNRIVVAETATDSEIFNAIVLHELTHSIEGTKQYAEIEKYVIEKKYNGNKEAYATDIKNKVSEYKRHNTKLDETDAKAEIVASSVEEYIFADDVKSIVEQDYTFAQKVYDYIGELIYSLKSKYGNTLDIDRLKHAQRQYRMALESERKTNSKSQGHYSIETISGTNKKYVKFDRGLRLGENKSEWPSKIENYIKTEILKNGDFNVVTEDGDNIVINGRTAWKIADVEKTENGVKVPMSDNELRLKYEAGSHIDELVEISKRGKENKPDDGSHNWADEWDYRTAFFEDSNGNYYRVKISVGINEKEAAAYNLSNFRKRGTPSSGSSSANGDGGARGSTSQEVVYHDSALDVKDQKTDFELAYEKALEKKNGQFSFATEESVETGDFTDVDNTRGRFCCVLNKIKTVILMDDCFSYGGPVGFEPTTHGFGDNVKLKGPFKLFPLLSYLWHLLF